MPPLRVFNEPRVANEGGIIAAALTPAPGTVDCQHFGRRLHYFQERRQQAMRGGRRKPGLCSSFLFVSRDENGAWSAEMFGSTPAVETAVDDRVRMGPRGARSLLRRVADHRRKVFDLRHVCQAGALAWIASAIVLYPTVHARHEREARAVVKRLGGRYNVAPNRLADCLPRRVVEFLGGENLSSVTSINLAHSDVSDDDMEALLHFTSLEQINLCGCSRITPFGLARLRQLPRLKLVWVDGMSVAEAGRRLTGDPMAAAAQ
jgi:hypothetical protein